MKAERERIILKQSGGGRQVAKEYKDIMPNHVARYQWAINQLLIRLKNGGKILDAAAGTGYGSKMIAKAGFEVHAVELEPQVTEWGEQFYSHERVHRHTQSVLDVQGKFDAIVSIETIEHLKEDKQWIKNIGEMTDILIGTVPNQDVVAFNAKAHIHHERHYTKAQTEALMKGWTIEGWWTQYDKRHPEKCQMTKGFDGMTLGFVAVKK